MNVLLDSNILIAAHRNRTGLAAQLLQAPVAGNYRRLLPPSVLEEVEAYFEAHASEAPADWDALRGLLRQTVTPIRGLRRFTGIRDARDQHVIEAALELGADLIVSQDKDLLSLKSAEGIPIVNIHEFAYTLGIRH